MCRATCARSASRCKTSTLSCSPTPTATTPAWCRSSTTPARASSSTARTSRASASPAPRAATRACSRTSGRPSALKVLGHALKHGGARPARLDGAETFADGALLDVPGHFRVIHTPGHTPGHCALLDEARRILFAGDALIDHRLVTNGRGPQLMPRFTNVDTAQALASLDALEALDDRVDLVVFGHGVPWHDGVAKAVAGARRKAR